MTDTKSMMVYAASYQNLSDALADLDAVEQLHKDDIIGSFDAAVIDKKDGKPHVAKRIDRPSIRVIPEWFGGGTLPRKELHEAAGQLTSSQAGLIAVGEPTIEKALDNALKSADKGKDGPLRGAMPGMKLGAGRGLRVGVVVPGAVAGVEGACWGWRAVRRHRFTLDRSRP